MQILKNGCNVVRRRNAADETGGYILYTLKFCKIFIRESIEERIARVKPRSDKRHVPSELQCRNQGTDDFTYLPDGH